MVSGGAKPSGQRAVARCDELGVAPYSDSADGLFRAYLTPAHAASLERLGGWMEEAGMAVRLDPAANLIGRYEGSDPDAPALLIGSHIDSVRDAGRYDGPLGIMLGIEAVAALGGRQMPFPIEVIAFGDEEGSRFPASMLCSRAIAGTLEAGALEVADRDGVGLVDAISTFPVRVERSRDTFSSDAPSQRVSTSLDTSRLFLSARYKTALAFLEPHIEQGPVLEAEGLALGVVSGIAAQLRYQVRITGKAGHAGTNAMHLRRDALTGAADAVLVVERIAHEVGGDLVATVGRMIVGPGAVNVVPGEVDFSIDVRSGIETVRNAAAERIVHEIGKVAQARGLELTVEQVQDLGASPCDAKLTAMLEDALVESGHRVRTLVSGAGHDTMVMASLCPTAMLFIRCEGGVSHNPAEAVTADDAEAALQVMRRFIDKLGANYVG
ncbi:allantoate amidohydrolase [Sphingomonas montanisoli]|uniref:Allantoate amidohydrolase n=1 Tax=Sphingomonas montanisoli TaxID=2606412 RepID=A0A5D9C9M5_9SPHN|nr:allantoate amidohydrolase [Sphingomonas montanisoli]TZG27852.1 allantoate amidohydrolase [Sphingomonas montanisoli]